MNAKTIAGYLAIALVTWWVIIDHNGAAHVMHNIGAFISTAASGLTNFFRTI